MDAAPTTADLLPTAARASDRSRPTWRAHDAGSPQVWVRAHGLAAGAVLFDTGGAPAFGGAAAIGRYACLCLEPVETLVIERTDDAAGAFAALSALAARAETGDWRDVPGPRPLVACAIAYDLGRPARGRPSHPLPQLWAARYRAAYVWDRATASGRVVAANATAADALRRALDARPSDHELVGPKLSVPQPRVDHAAYRSHIGRIHDHIRAGDAYQINYTIRFDAAVRRHGAPEALFDRLHTASPAPFAACMRLDPTRSVLSVSPERFLRWTSDGEVETRPIKGTRPRDTDPARDAAWAAELCASPKDRAEHVMIVDLERNDLGRICAPGTIRVARFAELESYATVHHLVSTISGYLRPDVSLERLLAATFPGGSITGAPKRRAMEIIEALEPAPRGVYCGAAGYLDAAGGGDLNLPIRTAWMYGDRVAYQAGGGIVADSDADLEWEEVQTKARAFFAVCEAD